MSAGRIRRACPLPDGFGWMEAAGAVAAGDVALEPELRAAGLLDPARVRALLDTAGGASGRARTALVPLPDGGPVLVLRGLRRGGWLGPLLGAGLAGPARPLRELAVTARLRASGAPVPAPALALAWRRGPRWNAAVATRLEPEARDAEAFLRAHPDPPRLRRALAAAGGAVRRFHDAGGAHADLHVKNLLVREAAGGTDVVVIDLDRARLLPRVDAARRMAELMRLYRSLRKRALLDAAGGARGCAVFLGGYTGGDRALRRSLLERLPAERRRVALHALLYRPARR